MEQKTVMPNLRLSWEEARDIASYLMTLKQPDASYRRARRFLNDPKLKAQGHAMVQRLRLRGLPRNRRHGRRRPHRHRAHQGRLQAHRAD